MSKGDLSALNPPDIFRVLATRKCVVRPMQAVIKRPHTWIGRAWGQGDAGGEHAPLLSIELCSCSQAISQICPPQGDGSSSASGSLTSGSSASGSSTAGCRTPSTAETEHQPSPRSEDVFQRPQVAEQESPPPNVVFPSWGGISRLMSW